MAHTCLVIYAHPNKNGFCGEFLRCVEEQLQSRHCDYEVVDLYGMQYDPVLKQQEHYTSGGYDIAPENRILQEKIQQATHLVFIYPIWWQNMPAILKGFVDRVFTSRFAFRYIHNLPFGLLKGRRAAVFVSSGGPRIYTLLATGDRALTVLVRDVLRFCGIKTKGFMIGGARVMTEKKKKKISRIVRRGMAFLFRA